VDSTAACTILRDAVDDWAPRKKMAKITVTYG
jgi:hypothetical protein